MKELEVGMHQGQVMYRLAKNYSDLPAVILETVQNAIDPNDNQFIKPLFDELMKVNKSNETLAKTGKILLQADQNLPYATLRKIMYTASMAGFPNLKLITTVSE